MLDWLSGLDGQGERRGDPCEAGSIPCDQRCEGGREPDYLVCIWALINHRLTYHPTRYTPLTLLLTDASGKASIDRNIVLDQREIAIPIDATKPWKLNAGTVGVCA